MDVCKGLTFNDQVHVPLLAEREGVRVSISSLNHGIMKEKAKNEKGFQPVQQPARRRLVLALDGDMTSVLLSSSGSIQLLKARQFK